VTDLRTIRYGYRRPGKPSTTYLQELLLDRSDVSVLRLQHTRDLKQGDEIILPAGGFSLWFVFPDQWYDVGRFHRADASVTGWYTNLCTPVVKSRDDWSSTDLFLDLWQPASGGHRWLDEDELDDAVARNLLDVAQQEHVRLEREKLEALLAANAGPPALCRSFSIPPA
jgi:predicted RNA-binding protein associated with RNAse of E/G family